MPVLGRPTIVEGCAVLVFIRDPWSPNIWSLRPQSRLPSKLQNYITAISQVGSRSGAHKFTYMHSTHFCGQFLRAREIIVTPFFSQTGTSLHQTVRISVTCFVVDLTDYTVPFLNAGATERWPRPKIWAKFRTFHPGRSVWVKISS